MRSKGTRKAKRKGLKKWRVVFLSPYSIEMAPENDAIYDRPRADDPKFRAFVESIRADGVMEPIVISEDNYILSGHRRYLAALELRMARVPCRIHRVNWRHEPKRFERLLTEFNRQRLKTPEEELREAIVQTSPGRAYRELRERRKQRLSVSGKLQAIEVERSSARARISHAKSPLQDAIKEVVFDSKPYWPTSVRGIHYGVVSLPQAPLVHASKPNSMYRNDLKSYRCCIDLVARMRLKGIIPWESVSDETRPRTVWPCFSGPGPYVIEELEYMFSGYRRDLLRSQPVHVELVLEKLALSSVITPIAEDYCVPLTIGRGYCSLEPRHAIAQRFKCSGKDRLELLILSDHDADGLAIADNLARSLRDEFHVAEMAARRVALTREQVQKYGVVRSLEAKSKSARSRKYVDKYGNEAWELEAIRPKDLERETRAAIESILDMQAFREELKREKNDSQVLVGARQRVLDVLGEPFGKM